MFGPIRGMWPDNEWKGWWRDEPPYHGPIFVLTHHERPSKAKLSRLLSSQIQRIWFSWSLSHFKMGGSMDEPTMIFAAVMGTFFVAGIVKGITGMGLPTVAMGILGSLISPLAAASLLLIPSFTTNVWQLLAGPSFNSLLRRLWTMMLAILVGTMAGSTLLTSGHARITTGFLGAALAIYAGYTLFARQLHVPAMWEWWLSPLVGLVTGLATGATGVFVIPAVPYLQALNLSKEDMIQALGLSFTVSTVALAVALVWHNAWSIGNLSHSALALIPAFVGMWVGQLIRAKVDPRTFRRWFLICLLLLGGEMLIRSLF